MGWGRETGLEGVGRGRVRERCIVKPVATPWHSRASRAKFIVKIIIHHTCQKKKKNKIKIKLFPPRKIMHKIN